MTITITHDVVAVVAAIFIIGLWIHVQQSMNPGTDPVTRLAVIRPYPLFVSRMMMCLLVGGFLAADVCAVASLFQT